MIDKNMLPKPAIMNPNYISLPSEWDSSVSQIEMLQRLLYNVNQIISVLKEYADVMQEMENNYQEIVSKYETLKSEIITLINEYNQQINERLSEQDIKIEERLSAQDSKISDKIIEIDNRLDVQDLKIQENLDYLIRRFDELETNYLQIIKDAIDNYTRHLIIFDLTDDGYFRATYSDNWDDLIFNTTGYDINVPTQPQYGHLVLSY